MTKKYDPGFAFRNKRKPIRQPNHNYGWTGTYFITIRAKTHDPIFENPVLRTILTETWQALPNRYPGLTLDEFVIMPDHIHFIIHLEGNVEKPVTLAQVIGSYKSIIVVTWQRYIETNNLNAQARIWQDNYYDRIIRDNEELENTRQYIRNNPTNQKTQK